MHVWGWSAVIKDAQICDVSSYSSLQCCLWPQGGAVLLLITVCLTSILEESAFFDRRKQEFCWYIESILTFGRLGSLRRRVTSRVTRPVKVVGLEATYKIPNDRWPKKIIWYQIFHLDLYFSVTVWTHTFIKVRQLQDFSSDHAFLLCFVLFAKSAFNWHAASNYIYLLSVLSKQLVENKIKFSSCFF